MRRDLLKDSLYERFHRAPREPLLMLDELAEEFKVARGQLVYALQHRGGPKPVISGKSNQASRKNYYLPSEMRKWWKNLDA